MCVGVLAGLSMDDVSDTHRHQCRCVHRGGTQVTDRRRKIALIQLADVEISAEIVAHAFRSRRDAVLFFRACADFLEPPLPRSLFDPPDDAA